MDQLQAGEAVPLFTDQWLTPTRAGQAADDASRSARPRRERARITWPVASCVTPYEFGKLIAEIGGHDAELLGTRFDGRCRP
ncbi:MAG: hypothetical protein U5K28_10240 [Halobacteriales archaeon]|nr:hypothetical protein [Halobacteriales archaeon]